MNDLIDQTTDYKRAFELLGGADTEWTELIDGRYPRTLRELEEYQRNGAMR
jgi:hypothetical protein